MTQVANVRYIVDDVAAAVAFYTKLLGFSVQTDAIPAFAAVTRGPLRLLLSGARSSGGRTLPDGRVPAPGGWNRVELVVEDLPAEVERLHDAGVRFRNEIISGPGGSQALIEDPAGNPIELFAPETAAPSPAEERPAAGTPNANKAVVRRFVEEIFVRGNAAAVDDLVAPDFVPHTWPFTGDGRADLRRAIERVGKGLADAEFTIDDLIAEGDRVAARLTASAKQVGEFMGLPASGKTYSIGEIHIFRLRDGQVVEHWHQFDGLGMQRQLGDIPRG